MTTLDKSRGETSHAVMGFLSDGRRFVFSDNLRGSTYYVTSLSSPTERHRLAIPGGPRGVLVLSTSGGQLSTTRAGRLRFRRSTRRRSNCVHPWRWPTDGVHPPPRAQEPSCFARPRIQRRSSAWVNRTGRRLSTVGAPDTYLSVELSPSATRAAVVRGGPWIYDIDLWLADLATGVFTPLTSHPGLEADPAWSPDERRIAYSSEQAGIKLPFAKDVISGREDRLVDVSNEIVVDDWTADGRFLIVRDMRRSVFAVPMTGEAAEASRRNAIRAGPVAGFSGRPLDRVSVERVRRCRCLRRGVSELQRHEAAVDCRSIPTEMAA